MWNVRDGTSKYRGPRVDRFSLLIAIAALGLVVAAAGLRVGITATAEEGAQGELSEGYVEDTPEPAVVRRQVRYEGMLALHKIKLSLGDIQCGEECGEIVETPGAVAEALVERCARLDVSHLDETGFFTGESATELLTLEAMCASASTAAEAAASGDAEGAAGILRDVKDDLGRIPTFAERE